MRNQLSVYFANAMNHVRCTLHGSKLGGLCVGARSVHSDVDAINKELADVFGSPCASDPSQLSPDSIHTASGYEGAGTLGQSSNGWHNSSAANSSAHSGSHCRTAADMQHIHSLEEPQEFQPAIEQLHLCTVQLQEQLQAMSHLVQELSQSQQLQRQQAQHPISLQSLRVQHQQQQQRLHVDVPANHAFFPSSQPATPPAVPPRPARLQQQQQPSSVESAEEPLPWSLKGEDDSNSSSNSSSSAKQGRQQLTHVDSSGRASMVDVSSKGSSSRKASASCIVHLGQTAFDLVKHNALAKGDVLTLAQVAGIQGAKQTSSLIPLCHNIFLSKVDVQLKLVEEGTAVAITATAKTVGQTGVEMEALTAAAVAALTVYDMCKAVSKDIEIGELRLDFKEGGKSGTWVRASSTGTSSNN